MLPVHFARWLDGVLTSKSGIETVQISTPLSFGRHSVDFLSAADQYKHWEMVPAASANFGHQHALSGEDVAAEDWATSGIPSIHSGGHSNGGYVKESHRSSDRKGGSSEKGQIVMMSQRQENARTYHAFEM
jgi:hypothetical protein